MSQLGTKPSTRKGQVKKADGAATQRKFATQYAKGDALDMPGAALGHKVTPAAIIAQINGADASLASEIAVLEAENFNGDQYINHKCQAMSENNIRTLCKQLADYKRMSAEQMQKTVYENYKSFIRSSKEIADLEGELRSIHTLLTAQANVLRSLTERPTLATTGGKSGKDYDRFAGALEDDAQEAQERRDSGLRLIPEQMVVCLAERNYEEALRLLEQGEGELLVLRTRMRSGAIAAGGGAQLGGA